MCQALGIGAWQPRRETAVGGQLLPRPEAPANRRTQASCLRRATAFLRHVRYGCALTRSTNALPRLNCQRTRSRRVTSSMELGDVHGKSPSFRGVSLSACSVINSRWSTTGRDGGRSFSVGQVAVGNQLQGNPANAQPVPAPASRATIDRHLVRSVADRDRYPRRWQPSRSRRTPSRQTPPKIVQIPMQASKPL